MGSDRVPIASSLLPSLPFPSPQLKKPGDYTEEATRTLRLSLPETLFRPSPTSSGGGSRKAPKQGVEGGEGEAMGRVVEALGPVLGPQVERVTWHDKKNGGGCR